MHAPCLLFTEDDALARYLAAFLADIAPPSRARDAGQAVDMTRDGDPVLLFIDLTSEGALNVLHAVRRGWPDSLIVALGDPRADPALEAEAAGVYAVAPPTIGRLQLQGLTRRAMAHLDLIEENRCLREMPGDTPRPFVNATPAGSAMPTRPLGPLTDVMRDSESLNAMLPRICENTAAAVGSLRIGIFAQDPLDNGFRLRGACHCLPETFEVSLAHDDPFVRCLERQPQLVARVTLAHEPDPQTRIMLKRRLDQFGAEAIAPLHGRDRLIGWLLAGRLTCGAPYDATRLERLAGVAADVAIVLENGLLSEVATAQKLLAETVLLTIPSGIVAVDARERVVWCNAAAETLLGLRASDVLGGPAGRLGARLGDVLTCCARGRPTSEPVTWTEPATQKPLAVVTRLMQHGSDTMGAVAILQDLTQERLLRERKERIDRAEFWTELAAAISHEIRNPLVAISTFAQLLPERYDDAEFREQFGTVAVREIERLNSLIEQIDGFANPPELHFADIDLVAILNRAIRTAKQRLNSGVPVRVTAPKLPSLRGDGQALGECFEHLITNAIEATHTVSDPSIFVTVSRQTDAESDGFLSVRIQDNGPGIPPHILDKAFSPFCTLKPRGIGLGLTIARRTVTDHGGHIDLQSAETGTTVDIELPMATPAPTKPQPETVAAGRAG